MRPQSWRNLFREGNGGQLALLGCNCLCGLRVVELSGNPSSGLRARYPEIGFRGIPAEWAEAHASLGEALVAKGRIDDAIMEYRRAIELNPELAGAHINLGLILADQGQHDEAIAEYHKAISIQPNLANAHYNLGLALAAKGRRSEAIAEFREAIRIIARLKSPLKAKGLFWLPPSDNGASYALRQRAPCRS